MADFNPKPNMADTPNFTNRAPDVGPNRAFESLFSGLGDFIDNATTTADTRIKSQIENDARYGFDSLNDANNVSVDTSLPKNAVPQEILGSQSGLQRLAQAQIQGKITPEYYYQQLASQLKGLRAKYPGYEKEVDDIVMNVTGTRPANAYRDALFSNIQNEQNAMATQRGMFDKWLSKDSNMGLAVTMFPDLLTNPEAYSSDAKRAQVMTTVESQQGRLQMTKNAADLQNADKTVAGPALSQFTSQIIQSHLHGAVEGTNIGKDGNLLSAALADGQITPDEKQNILGYIQKTKYEARQDVLNRWSRGEMGKNFTRDEVNKEIDASLADLTQIEGFVSAGELDQAALAGDRLKALQDQNTMDLYQKFPDLKTANAIGQFSPDGAKVIMDEIIKKNGGGLNFLNKALSQDMTLSGLTSPDKMGWDNQINALEQAKGKTGKEKEAVLGSVLNNSLDAIKSGKLSAAQTSQYVQENYGKHIDDLFNVVDDSLVSGQSQRFRLFTKLFDPKVTASIKASGDPAALKTYMAAAFDKAQQVPEFRRAAADLKEDQNYSKYVRVSYDPERNRVDLKINREAMQKDALAQQFIDPAQRMDQLDSRVEQIQKASNAYNQVLGSLVPIIEASGMDELKGVQQFSRNLSLNLNGGKEDQGFFGYVDKEIRDLQDAKNPPKVDENGKEEKSPTSKWEDIPDTFTNKEGDLEWEFGNSEEEIKKNKEQNDKLMKEQEKNLVSGYADTKDNTPASIKAFDDGDLTTSTKRGYQPDLAGLVPEFKNSVSELQRSFGKKLVIVSGYRDPARNARAGGAKHSQHMHGDAVDLDVSDWSREDRIRLIQMAREQGFGGIGVYPNSIHLDKGRTRAWGPSYHRGSLPSWAAAVL